MAVRIKICGLMRAADAVAAEVAGATYGGVILAAGSTRNQHPSAVPGIFAGTRLKRCGVFVNESPDRIADISAELELHVIQLHGDESPEMVAAVRAATGAEVWKAIRPRSGDEFVAESARYDSAADALLLDGWSASARGGSGTRFPWDEVALHRDRLGSAMRLVVAGGLDPDNVAEVVRLLAPDVVDVSSGVESSPGNKDSQSIRRFVDAARGARQSGDLIDGSTVRV